MDDTINYLASNQIKHMKRDGLQGKGNSTALGATYGMLWLDIEGTGYWSSDVQSNINFLQAMVDQGNNRGVTLGKG